jgi:hypothetical protein
MNKPPEASAPETPTVDYTSEHQRTRRHRWILISTGICGGLIVIGAAIAIGLLLYSQATTITNLKHDKTHMANQISTTKEKKQKAVIALKAITVQLAKTKRALAVEKRKAANEYVSGYNSGVGNSASSYNDGYNVGYTDGYNEGLCVDPNTGGRVC